VSDPEQENKKFSISGLLGKLQDLVLEPLRSILSNPLLKLAALGLGILLLLILILAVVTAMPWEKILAAPAQPEESTAAYELSVKSELSLNDALSSKEEGNLSSSLERAGQANEDPFFTQALIPPEIDLFNYGELEFSRPPKASWSLEDLRPFWPQLPQALEKDLRKKNHEDFLKLLDESE